MAGFDCSGYVIEILKSVGLLPRSGDWTAHSLFYDMGWHQPQVIETGCLVFWRSATAQPRHGHKIIHVEFCLDQTLAIGASGGGGRTITEGDAIEQDAYIKVRPFRSRKHIADFRDPFYVDI